MTALPQDTALTTDQRNRALAAMSGDEGLDVLVVEQTSPAQRALGMHGVKVLVPGLVPIDFGWHHQRALRMPRTRERAAHYRSRHRLAAPRRTPAPVPHPFP